MTQSFSPYGDPNSGKVAARPACWGKQFDSDSRECRDCGWKESCREQVIQLNINRQPIQQQPNPVAQYQAPMPQYPNFQPVQYATPVQYQPPIQSWPAPPQPQVQQFRPVQVRQPTPVQQVQAQQQQMQQVRPQAIYLPQLMPGGFGSIGDPMFNVIGASPAPIRPQYEGETFVQRVAKNAALSGIEAMVGQVFLGIRQARWYPKPRRHPEQFVQTVKP